MKITASTEVHIDEKTQKAICINFLRRAMNFSDKYYIEEGKVIHSYSYRSWTEEKFVRMASEEDHALQKVLKVLSKEVE